MRNLIFVLLTILLAVPVQSDGMPPDGLIDQATRDLLVIIEQAQEYYDDEPERYFGEIEKVISPIVDFYSFSRGVMGDWGSKAYYNSLDDEPSRQHFDQQVARFTEVFRRALVETYGKGLMAFGGERIEVKPVAAKDVAKGKTYVIQLIHGEEPPPHLVRYMMRLDNDGHWRMRNVILDEINLGKVYRNQFAAAAAKYDGNVDRVIDNWRIDEDEAE